MKYKMIAILCLGIFCVLAGLFLVKPGIVAAFMVAVGGGFVGGCAIWFISTKRGTLVKDEMVVRVETLSGNYTFLATVWFVIMLGIVNIFYSLHWSVSELLMVMMLFMSLSNLLFRWIFLKRGKTE